MSETLQLRAELRDIVGRQVKKRRALGFVPAILYGHKIAARNMWLPQLAFSRVFRAGGENTIVELTIDEKEKVNVLIYDVQADPLTGKFIHSDLFQVRMDEEIEADIPLEFVGEAPAVKELGGMLLKNVDSITVRCLPAHLPHMLTVDISTLKTFEDHFTVSNLKVSGNVEIISEADTVIAGVAPPRTEAEMAELETKVEADVTKVEGVVKEEPAPPAAEAKLYF